MITRTLPSQRVVEGTSVGRRDDDDGDGDDRGVEHHTIRRLLSGGRDQRSPFDSGRSTLFQRDRCSGENTEEGTPFGQRVVLSGRRKVGLLRTGGSEIWKGGENDAEVREGGSEGRRLFGGSALKKRPSGLGPSSSTLWEDGGERGSGSGLRLWKRPAMERSTPLPLSIRNLPGSPLSLLEREADMLERGGRLAMDINSARGRGGGEGGGGGDGMRAAVRSEDRMECRNEIEQEGDALADALADVDAAEWDSMRCTYKCKNMVKSEFLETLEKREMELCQLEDEIKSLRAEKAEQEAEKDRMQNRIDALEQGLAASTEREKSVQQQRTKEFENSDNQLREQMRRRHELQARLQEELDLKSDSDAALSAAQERAVDAEQEVKRVVENSKRELQILQDDLDRGRKDFEFEIARFKAELHAERRRADAVTSEAGLLKEELEKMQKVLAENLKSKMELETRLAEATIAANAVRTRSNAEADEIIRQLSEELNHQAEEIDIARKLKQQHVNVELLKEKLESAEARAERAESAIATAEEERIKVEALERELEEWRAMAKGLPGVVEGKDDVGRKMGELQRDVLSGLAKCGELSAEVVRLKTALSSAESARKAAEHEVEASGVAVGEGISKLKAAECKAASLERQCQGLKSIIETYDQEEALISTEKGGDANLLQPSGTGTQPLKNKLAKLVRLQEVERSLVEAQNQVRQLEEVVKEKALAATQQRLLAEELRREIDARENQMKSLEREAQELGREVAILQSRVGKGEFDRSTTKILHMKFNPEMEARAKAQKDAQMVELDKLRERVRELEAKTQSAFENGGGSNKMSMGTSASSQELAGLSKRIAALEKREARYKQAFADKITCFREACYFLFGYKVDMSESRNTRTGRMMSTFALRSMFSDHKKEELLEFTYQDGCMDMLANDYATSVEIAPQVEIYLRRFKCIPAFTANVTMEQFNKSTMG